jgi:hypothetical protein
MNSSLYQIYTINAFIKCSNVHSIELFSVRYKLVSVDYLVSIGHELYRFFRSISRL